MVKEVFFSMWFPLILGVLILGWGIYWSVPHRKNKSLKKKEKKQWK